MSKVMVFSTTSHQPLPDPPYLTQMTGAKLVNASGATLVKIYDGIDATGELSWELQVSAAGNTDSDQMTPDGLILSSGSVFVDFISGSGDVLLLVK